MKTITKILFAISPAILLSASVANAQCTSGFTWTQPSNNVIAFTNTSTPIIPNSTFFYWNFGDNQTSWQQSPTHTYSAPGVYVACVNMYDSLSGCQSQFCDSITVTGSVMCNTSASAYQSQAATCSNCADGSATVNMYGGTAPYTYSWSSGSTSQTATGLLPGVYGVCVTDANGCMSCDSVYIAYANQTSCQASFTISQNQNSVTVTSTSTGITANTTYYWDFGDNSYGYQSTTNKSYQSAGTFTICLTIYDSLTQCTSTACDTVTVYSVSNSCNANFSIYMDSINPQQAWIWNTSTGGPGMTFQWFWGDNTSDTGMFASHIYNQTGSYNVCLVIIDQANLCSDTMCQLLMVPRMSQQTASQPFYVNCLGATGIQHLETASVFNIYPNPAESEIKIKTDYALQGKNFKVLDISGREIITGKLNGNTLDVSSLEKGMYLLQIENATGGFSAQRFMKD
jgi:PKD repeat protein